MPPRLIVSLAIRLDIFLVQLPFRAPIFGSSHIRSIPTVHLVKDFLSAHKFSVISNIWNSENQYEFNLFRFNRFWVLVQPFSKHLIMKHPRDKIFLHDRWKSWVWANACGVSEKTKIFTHLWKSTKSLQLSAAWSFFEELFLFGTVKSKYSTLFSLLSLQLPILWEPPKFLQHLFSAIQLRA